MNGLQLIFPFFVKKSNRKDIKGNETCKKPLESNFRSIFLTPSQFSGFFLKNASTHFT